jgi:pilus assembly protein CpaE
MMPDIDGYEVATRLREHPATEQIPILMFTAKNAVTDKIAGFQAGVDDYLTKPIHPSELTSRVEALLHRTQRTSGSSIITEKTDKGRIIAFLPSKGGIGNSTLLVNTAVELKNMHSEAKVVAAELHPGLGTLGMQMDFAGALGLSSLVSQPLSALTKDLLRRNINTHTSGVHILCCTAKPEGFGPALSKEYLRTILRYLSDDYDFVLIDVPPTLTEPYIEVLNLSETILLSLEPSPFCVELADGMMGCLKLMDVGIHKVNLVLVQRSPVTGSISRTTVEQKLKREMISSVPYVPELAYQSAEEATPIALLEPNGVFSQQIRRIVQVIVEE